MIHVRRHTRQMASGKTATVTQHERNVTVRPRAELDAEWRASQSEQPPPGEEGQHPEGTVFFEKDGQLFAVHPDATVYPVGGSAGDGDDGDDGDETAIAGGDDEDPPGTMFFRSGDDIIAARPDGTARTLPRDDDPDDVPAGPDHGETWDLGHTQARDIGLSPKRGRISGSQSAAVQARTRERLNAAHERDMRRMADDMRKWRSRPAPEPGPAGPMDPAKARLLGCDTPEGQARYDRLRAYRDAGYDGPLNQDNEIPDPDDPATWDGISMMTRLAER